MDMDFPCTTPAMSACFGEGNAEPHIEVEANTSYGTVKIKFPSKDEQTTLLMYTTFAIANAAGCVGWLASHCGINGKVSSATVYLMYSSVELDHREVDMGK